MHLTRQQDNFLYWSGQKKASLKAKRVWYAMRGDDAASSFASYRHGTDITDTVTRGVVDDEYVRDVACSVILREVGGRVSFVCIMAHQNYLR